MITISSPSSFSGFDRTAVFSFTGSAADAGSAIDAVLEDADTGQVIAARRLHLDAAATARFDTAPLLRRTMMLCPTAGATGLAAADDAMFRVRMRVGTTVTEPVRLLCTLPEWNALTCISVMPRQRTIRYGESDRLMFFSLSDFTVRVETRTADGKTAETSYSWNGDGGLVVLRLRTGDFDPDTCSICVRISGSTVAEYAVVPPEGSRMRIAWRSELGTVEHYTFPVVARRTAVGGTAAVTLAGGVCTVAGTAHDETVLKSHCEPAAVVDMLAAIARSPQVWAVDDETEEYVSVAVVTQQVVTRSFGEPSNVELTVRPSQNGVAL